LDVRSAGSKGEKKSKGDQQNCCSDMQMALESRSLMARFATSKFVRAMQMFRINNTVLFSASIYITPIYDLLQLWYGNLVPRKTLNWDIVVMHSLW
jgi:hypothetical protein